ncbi:MAG: glycine zipper domain-containing protein [Polyangia bacterium]
MGRALGAGIGCALGAGIGRALGAGIGCALGAGIGCALGAGIWRYRQNPVKRKQGQPESTRPGTRSPLTPPIAAIPPIQGR